MNFFYLNKDSFIITFQNISGKLVIDGLEGKFLNSNGKYFFLIIFHEFQKDFLNQWRMH